MTFCLYNMVPLPLNHQLQQTRSTIRCTIRLAIRSNTRPNNRFISSCTNRSTSTTTKRYQPKSSNFTSSPNLNNHHISSPKLTQASSDFTQPQPTSHNIQWPYCLKEQSWDSTTAHLHWRTMDIPHNSPHLIFSFWELASPWLSTLKREAKCQMSMQDWP